MTPQGPEPAAPGPADGRKDRRPKALDVVKVLGALVAALACVYAIGWLTTLVRLAAARLHVDASLPMMDNTTLFLAGLRLAAVMTIVSATLCALAWVVHAWTWAQRAPDWHSLMRHGRRIAATRHPRVLRRRSRPAADDERDGEPLVGHVAGRPPRRERLLQSIKPKSRPPADLHEAPVGDRFVRLVAGLNVGVLGATFGLAAARVLKAPIDQAFPPRPWWDLVGPWAVVSGILCLLLAWVGPLWGNRWVQAALWVAVVVVALLSSAPFGILLLTWAGVASLGRAYGRGRTKRGRGILDTGRSRPVAFALSPLPWLLLAVYMLLGIAYYGLPPVSFAQRTVTTATSTRVGGYLGRTDTSLYLVSCTPLADATSIDERVSAIAFRDIGSIRTGTTPFVLDSGLRPSLPTLALHALGIASSTPAWIRPELRTIRPTCAGDPLPASSVGSPDPALGKGVIAGPGPSGGEAVDGERPIEQSTPPKIAALAREYQPTVLVTVADPFWPVSVGAVLADRGPNGQQTCWQDLKAGMSCPSKQGQVVPTLDNLGISSSGPYDFLEYPVSPALTTDPEGQLDSFLRGQQGHITRVPTLRHRLSDPGLLDPWRTAQLYFYYALNVNPATWPAPDSAFKGMKLIALQYWFFYPYNYYPSVFDSGLMNDAPVAGDLANTDLHQGDWEHVTVLLDARTKTPLPVALYTARHSSEGEYYAWKSPLLTFDQGHVVVQAAIGGHPTYDAHCRESLRYAPALGVLRGRVADWIVCGSGRFAFRAATTPLVDVARTKWACWQGHFGVATASEIQDTQKAMTESSIKRTIDQNYYVAGPRSPLWQAENGRLAADQTPSKSNPHPTDHGVCANGGDPAKPEEDAIKAGL